MSVLEEFDPYRKWLGIPSSEQPPNHYRLLGVGLFEDDADTIASAADRQMAHVRTFQTGPHSALSQKLLNELAAARVALLNEAKKAAYDEQLRAKLLTPSAVTKAAEKGGAPAPPPVPMPTAVPRQVVAKPVPVAPAAGAGQGRAGEQGSAGMGMVSSPTPVSISERNAFGVSATATLSRRKRARPESAVWIGLAAAVLAVAAVAYFARGPLTTAVETANLAVQGSVPASSADGNLGADDHRSLDEPESKDNKVDDSAASDAASAHTAAAAAEPEKAATPGEPKDQPDNAMTARPSRTSPTAAPTTPEDSTPAASPSLADLLRSAERPSLPQTRRETPPEGQSLTIANGLFLQKFGNEIAGAKTPDAVNQLRIRLLNLAGEGSEPAEVRYVMLGTAGASAANQGRVGPAYTAATEITRQFDVDPYSVKLKALEAAGKNAAAPAAFAVGALQALALADRAGFEGKGDMASRAATQGAGFARKTKDKDLIALADRCKAALREQTSRHAAYLKSLADLKKSPDDREANLAAGKYEVLVLGKWREGLLKLSDSSEPRFVEIARMEVAARADPSQWPQLAAAWWLAAAAEAEEFFKLRCQQQAKYAYLRARAHGVSGGVAAEIAEQLKLFSGYPLSRLRPGAAARYYDGAELRYQRVERVDPAVVFFFGESSPDPSIPNNFFSARWTGFIKPPISGRYRFVTFTNDSVRLWIDGAQVLNRWGQNAQWQQVDVELSNELHTFKLEYNETFEVGIAVFGWNLAGFPDADHLQFSPVDALYYDPESPFELPELESQ